MKSPSWIVSSCCCADIHLDSLMCLDCGDHCGATCLQCDEEWYDTKQHNCKNNGENNE